jgi:hypothetical protein
MSVNDYVLVRGMSDTRATLARWQADPLPVLGGWMRGALGVGCFVLFGVWVVAVLSTPDLTVLHIPGLSGTGDFGDVARTIGRNLLVLAFHATACVAGFIAGSSIPLAAERRTGFSRKLHEHSGRIAIALVVAVTIFSLSNQIYILGGVGATIALQLDLSPAELVLTLLPHALLELTAVFLPLAAWLALSRRGDWNQMLAATFVTVAVALPMIFVSALIEVFIWPEVLRAVSPLAGSPLGH